MKNCMITISREFGSGGHTIGKEAADKFNTPCDDNELIQKIAQTSGFVENQAKEADENTPKGYIK